MNDIFDDTPMGKLYNAAFAHGVKSGYVPLGKFQLSRMKDFTPVILFSNKTMDSDCRTKHRLSFYFLWESQSVAAAVDWRKTKLFAGE